MIKSNNNYNLHPLLNNIIGNKILDYRLRTRIDEKYIPQFFNSNIVFQSFNSFQQNNLKLSKLIRKFVKNCINTDKIQAFGGESYLYTSNKSSCCYSNSNSIYNDMLYNGYKNIKLVDYNNDKFVFSNNNIVLNLSKLNKNLMEQINNSFCNRLIIINCHHKDFWKKIKLLDNFKLSKRKNFIDYHMHYFISVNILIRKSFIPIGGNCAVTYQLNKYNLRKNSYPFDWMKIKINKLKDVFDYNFINYDNLDLFKYSLNHNSWVYKNKYGSFAHEYINHFDLDEFKQKIIKRINNFNNIKNPVFVRLEISSFKNITLYTKYWIDIIKILKKIHDDFQIILISNINPNLKEIKWYSYNYSADWKNNQLDWKNILLK